MKLEFHSNFAGFSFGQIRPRGKGAMRLTLCEAQPVKQGQTTTPGIMCPTCVLETA